MGHYDLPTDAEVIANLRAQLADRDAEIERLRDEMADYDNTMLRRFDAGAAESTDLVTWIGCNLAEIKRLRARLDAESSHRLSLCADNERFLAEIERLRADLVWAVRKGVMVGHDECVRPCIWFDVHRGVEYDGTPDSICWAVREARDGR